MSDNPTSGQTPTHRSESSPAPQTAGSGLHCSPFIRAFTQPLTAACVTLSRPCVRRVLWFPGFPLGSVLRSIDSAGTGVPLFADFTATIPESDFSMPFIFGYGFLLSSATPPRQRDDMETSQVPVQCVRTCLGSLTPRDSDAPRHIGESDAAFDTRNCLGIPDPIFSVLDSPARTRPCQRLTPALASDGP